MTHCKKSILPAATPEIVEVVVDHLIRYRPNDRLPTAISTLDDLDVGPPLSARTHRVVAVPSSYRRDDLLLRMLRIRRRRIRTHPNRNDVCMGGREIPRNLVRAHDPILSHSSLHSLAGPNPTRRLTPDAGRVAAYS